MGNKLQVQVASIGHQPVRTVKTEYDPRTLRWFGRFQFEKVTVQRCMKCGVWCLPRLGHDCKVVKR